MAFNFGSTTTTTAATGFSLGGPPAKAPATGGFGFGAPAATTATPATGGFSFASGTTAVPATTSTAAAPAFGGFGASTNTTAAPTLGGFGATTTTSSVPTLGGFGAPAATTAASGGFGGFGVTSTPAATQAFGTATTTTSAPPTFGLGLPASTAASNPPTVTGLGGNTTAPVLGLGGTGGVQGGPPAVSQENKGEGPSGKESMIPQELFNTVEDLKKMIKEEKAISSEVSHTSDKQLKKVKEETEALSQLVSGLATGVQNNRAKLEQLKILSGQELVNVEIAVRTRDTPPNMQYENVAPMEYFRRLVSQFEQSMVEYRQGIMSAEQHLQAVSAGCPITSGDIVAAVQKLHQALTDLAAKYQVVHADLTQQKCEYLSLQRQLSGSSSNTHLLSKTMPSSALPASLKGPSPFTSPADPLTQARQTQLHRAQQPQCGQGPPTQPLGQHTGTWGAQPTAPAFGANTSAFGINTGFGANTSGFGSNTSGFGANTTGFGTSSTGFGTSTPGFGASTGITSGTKRGKH